MADLGGISNACWVMPGEDLVSISNYSQAYLKTPTGGLSTNSEIAYCQQGSGIISFVYDEGYPSDLPDYLLKVGPYPLFK